MPHRFSIKEFLGEGAHIAAGRQLGRQFPDCGYAGIEGEEVVVLGRAGRAVQWLINESSQPRLLIITPKSWRPNKRVPAIQQIQAVRRGEIRPNGRVVLDEPAIAQP